MNSNASTNKKKIQKKMHWAGHQWLMPVILPIQFEANPGK
jgi:hypothetical protein